MQNMIGVVPNAVEKFWFHTSNFQLSIVDTLQQNILLDNKGT